jgi:hypothetical protein
VSFDLLAYGAEHRCRVRNLHDGAAVPPMRRGVQRSPGYRGADGMLAIIGRRGHVARDGQRLSWFVASGHPSYQTKPILAAGGVVQQDGDGEAAGHAPIAALAAILRAIGAYRKATPPASAAARLVAYRFRTARRPAVAAAPGRTP